jgi:hypothetical protein
MLTDHLSNASWTLPALDLDVNLVGDAQGIGRHIFCLQNIDTRARKREPAGTGAR